MHEMLFQPQIFYILTGFSFPAWDCKAPFETLPDFAGESH